MPVSGRIKAWLIVVPFVAAAASEGSGWLVRFVHPGFAVAKVGSFLLLQGSLLALIVISLWAVFVGTSENYMGLDEDDDFEDDP